MPITIPGTLKLTTKPITKPGAMTAALAAPGCVSIKSSGTVDGGSVALEATVAANRRAYWFYSWRPANAGEQPSSAMGAIVEGFAGVTQGGLVFIADDGTLSHTPVATTNPIGIGVRSTAIYFFVDPMPGAV